MCRARVRWQLSGLLLLAPANSRRIWEAKPASAARGGRLRVRVPPETRQSANGRP